MNDIIYKKYKKSHLTYIILLLCSGFLGLHDIYLKRTKEAEFKVCLTLISIPATLFLGPLSCIPTFILKFLLLKDLILSSKHIKQYNNSLYSILNGESNTSDNITSELYKFLEKKPEEYEKHFGITGFFFAYDMYLEETKKCILKNLIFIVPYILTSLYLFVFISSFIAAVFGGFIDALFWSIFSFPLTILTPLLSVIIIYPIILIGYIIVSILSLKREKNYSSFKINKFNRDLYNEIIKLQSQTSNTCNL